MGFWRDFLLGQPEPSPSTSDGSGDAPAFSVAIDPATLYGVASLDEAIQYMSTVQKVTRQQAMTVPAVIGARDRICALGQLPLRVHDAENKPVDGWEFVAQPERGRAGSTTWTNVLDDLLFSGRAFIALTHTGWHGYPAQGARLEPESVTVQPQMVTHRTATATGVSVEYPEDPQLLRIDSPKDPLLVSGARAIRTLLRLEMAALNASDGVPPMDFFTPAEGVDPPQETVTEALDLWHQLRQAAATGYVPAWLNYHVNGFNPEQLQLVQSREFAIAEIARLTGLDGEDLNVPTTSRTYFNAQDRRRNFLDFVGGPYPGAIEDRLSMDDVTPPGFSVQFDLSGFMQADDKTQAETDEILVRSGLNELDEARARRGLGPSARAVASPAEEPADA